MALKAVKIQAVQVDGFKAEVRAGNHVLYVDQPVAGGGTDAGPNPLEYLFISLAGCMVAIGNIIAKQKRLPVRKIEVDIEGRVETDVFMGKSTDARPGFSGIIVRVNIDADMTREEKEQYLQEIDARCPISDNIHNQTPVEFVVS